MSRLNVAQFLLGDRYFESTEIAWTSGSFVGIFFFLSYYYIANFLVLRMFIALILENFEYNEDQKINIQIQLYQRLQILRNDLIDGHAREFSLEEQFIRLRKQNLDEEQLKKYENQWTQIVKDRAAEGGGGANSENEADGLLWNVLIEAASRKEENLGKEIQNFEGLQATLRNVMKLLRKMIYNFVENWIVDFGVLLAVIFSVVLVQVRQNDNRVLYIASLGQCMWQQSL